jgi:hypothetical protein
LISGFQIRISNHNQVPNVASKYFKNVLGPKITYLDLVHKHKKTFLEHFSSISWGVGTGIKGKKSDTFRIKGEFLKD